MPCSKFRIRKIIGTSECNHGSHGYHEWTEKHDATMCRCNERIPGPLPITEMAAGVYQVGRAAPCARVWGPERLARNCEPYQNSDCSLIQNIRVIRVIRSSLLSYGKQVYPFVCIRVD